jgi:hypothetical protein
MLVTFADNISATIACSCSSTCLAREGSSPISSDNVAEGVIVVVVDVVVARVAVVGDASFILAVVLLDTSVAFMSVDVAVNV